jgi:hypothetical protein
MFLQIRKHCWFCHRPGNHQAKMRLQGLCSGQVDLPPEACQAKAILTILICGLISQSDRGIYGYCNPKDVI